MTRIHKGLVTTGVVAAMFGGGAVGAVALAATGTGSAATTTTTTPSITVAPSTGTTTTPSRGSGQGAQNCPDHGAPRSSGSSAY